jgi:hypothetical protein
VRKEKSREDEVEEGVESRIKVGKGGKGSK